MVVLRPQSTLPVGACAALLLAAACGCSSATPRPNAAGAPASPSTNPSPSPRGSASAGPIRITDAYLPQPASPDVAAVYFTVTDASAQADTLLSATSVPAAQVELMSETSSGNAESMSEMSGGLLVPAHGNVALGPGGYHVMLTDPVVPLKQGGTVALTLTFRRAGKLVLDVPITSLLSDAQTGSGATDAATSMSNMPGM